MDLNKQGLSQSPPLIGSAMLLWSVLALFALGAVSEDTVTTEVTVTKQLTTLPDSSKDPEPIPYSNGSGQVFETSDELIQSFRQQQPVSPELPAVIPSAQQLPTKIPSKDLEAPLETINTPASTISTPGSTVSTTGSTMLVPGSTITVPGYIISGPGSTVSTPGSTNGPAPPLPTFSRSLRLRDELTVPSSDYTEVYDIAWHAESNTARTVIENMTTIYRTLQTDNQVQFLKIEENGRALGNPQRICTKSPPIPASLQDKSFPGLPDIAPFQFIGYNTEGGRQLEHWQHVVVGKPGEGGAVQGESLNFTHDFFVLRDGDNAVPLRYTVVTDSSVLGAASDSYTHHYTVLPPPMAPIFPDTAKECDVLEDFQAEPQPTEKSPQKIDLEKLEEILTPTLL